MMRQHHLGGEKAFIDYSGKRIGDRRCDDGRDPRGGEFRRRARRLDLAYAEATWTRRCRTGPAPMCASTASSAARPGFGSRRSEERRRQASFYDPRSTGPIALSRPLFSGESAHATLQAARQGRGRSRVRFARPTVSDACARRPSSRSPNAIEAIALIMRRSERTSMRRLGLSGTSCREDRTRRPDAAACRGLEFAESRRARVDLDCHVEVHEFLYSGPHALIRAEDEDHITARAIEMFHRRTGRGSRAAYMGRKHTTNPEHMPSSHRRYAGVDAGAVPPLGRQVGPTRKA